MKKLIPLGRKLADSLEIEGWRQASHQLKKIKQQVRQIAQLSASKSPKVKAEIPAYSVLLQRVGSVLDRTEACKKLLKKRT